MPAILDNAERGALRGEQIVLQVIAEVANVEAAELTPETELVAQLNIDSPQALQILVELEERPPDLLVIDSVQTLVSPSAAGIPETEVFGASILDIPGYRREAGRHIAHDRAGVPGEHRESNADEGGEQA